MSISARNDGGPFDYVADTLGDLDAIPVAQTGARALILADGGERYYTGSGWAVLSGAVPGYFDVRDYGVVAGASAADVTDGLNAALTASVDKPCYIPPDLGQLELNDTVNIHTKNILICPMLGGDVGTQFMFNGPDGSPAFRFTSGGAAVSRVHVQGIRVTDIRTGATSGGGFVSDTVALRNGGRIIDCNAFDFPDYGFYFNATSGSDGELMIDNCWSIAGLYGFYFKDMTQQVTMRNIFGDSVTGDSTMSALIYLDSTSMGLASFTLIGAKLETSTGCHLLQMSNTWRAPTTAIGLTMRGAGPGGDVVRFDHNDPCLTVIDVGSRYTNSSTAGSPASSLVNDVNAGVTYGGGTQRHLSFWTKTGATSGGAAYVGPGLKIDGELELEGALNHDGTTVGFYGVTPIARATLATGAGATVDNVITALQNLGLVKQS